MLLRCKVVSPPCLSWVRLGHSAMFGSMSGLPESTRPSDLLVHALELIACLAV
jgi:hypothetical protein